MASINEFVRIVAFLLYALTHLRFDNIKFGKKATD